MLKHKIEIKHQKIQENLETCSRLTSCLALHEILRNVSFYQTYNYKQTETTHVQPQHLHNTFLDCKAVNHITIHTNYIGKAHRTIHDSLNAGIPKVDLIISKTNVWRYIRMNFVSTNFSANIDIWHSRLYVFNLFLFCLVSVKSFSNPSHNKAILYVLHPFEKICQNE